MAAGDAAGRFSHSRFFTDGNRGPWGSVGRHGPGAEPGGDGAVLRAASLRHLCRLGGGEGGVRDVGCEIPPHPDGSSSAPVRASAEGPGDAEARSSGSGLFLADLRGAGLQTAEC